MSLTRVVVGDLGSTCGYFLTSLCLTEPLFFNSEIGTVISTVGLELRKAVMNIEDSCACGVFRTLRPVRDKVNSNYSLILAVVTIIVIAF
jgi:hypothetical protein